MLVAWFFGGNSLTFELTVFDISFAVSAVSQHQKTHNNKIKTIIPAISCGWTEDGREKFRELQNILISTFEIDKVLM